MTTGKIILKREKKNYDAGFCLLKEELSDLTGRRSLLHTDEQAYFNSLHHDRRKQSYLLGRVAAKKAIGEIAALQPVASLLIDTGIFQFPVVKHCLTSNIQVCISHCDTIGIAFAFPEDHPLGVDIERADEGKIKAIKGQITQKELEMVAAHNLSVTDGCTIIWTLKEALSKVLKTGMTMDFMMFELESLEKDGFLYRSTFRYCAQYKALSCLTGNYACSVILPKKTEPELDNFWKDLISTVNRTV